MYFKNSLSLNVVDIHYLHKYIKYEKKFVKNYGDFGLCIAHQISRKTSLKGLVKILGSILTFLLQSFF